MILPKKLLLDIYQNFLPKPVEVCGNFEEFEGNVFIVDVTEGRVDESNRPICTSARLRQIYFHTHPFKHKAYPSSEDILSMMKRKRFQIEKSLVFTSWGIWVISSRKKDDFSSEEKATATLKKLDKFGNELYRKTERGRIEINARNRERVLEDIRKFIIDILIEFRMFELSIDFHLWNVPQLIL